IDHAMMKALWRSNQLDVWNYRPPQQISAKSTWSSKASLAGTSITATSYATKPPAKSLPPQHKPNGRPELHRLQHSLTHTSHDCREYQQWRPVLMTRKSGSRKNAKLKLAAGKLKLA